jgi:hypothetical protein
VCIHKGKLLGRQLQACDFINKLNLNVILNSDLRCMDLSRLCISPYYLSQKIFVMIQQLGRPTFFVTFFTSVESKWLLLLKCLYDLNSKKLGFNIPFDKLEPKHVVDLIRCVTCAQYYDHHMKFFCTLCMKDNSIFGHLLDFFFVTKFQNCGSQHDHRLLWVANAPI